MAHPTPRGQKLLSWVRSFWTSSSVCFHLVSNLYNKPVNLSVSLTSVSHSGMLIEPEPERADWVIGALVTSLGSVNL